MNRNDHPDIIFIVLDAVRADRLGHGDDPGAPCPNVDRLAREGCTCSQAISTSCWTLESMGSIFTGLYPVDHGAHYGSLSLAKGLQTLPLYFESIGYHTLAISGNTAFIGPPTGFDRGFEVFREVAPVLETQRLPGFDSGAPMPLKRSGDLLADCALELLETYVERSEPFFLYLHFVDTHLPYHPPHQFAIQRLEKLGVGVDEANACVQDAAAHFAGHIRLSSRQFHILGALYDAALAASDHAVGRILDTINSCNRAAPLVIVTADHGEHLGEGGLMDHAFSLSDVLLHVPLIFWCPGRIEPGRTVKQQVQPVDLFPSLVELIKGADESWRLFPDRRGLLSGSGAPVGRRYALAQYTVPVDGGIRRRFPELGPVGQSMAMVRGDGWKVVYRGEEPPRLFNLTLDPSELQDRAASSPGMLQRLSTRLPIRMLPQKRRNTPFDDREQPFEMPADMEKRLKGLGYL